MLNKIEIKERKSNKMSLEFIIAVLSISLISLLLALIFIVFIVSLFNRKSKTSNAQNSLNGKNVVKYPQTNNILLKRNISSITYLDPQKVNHSKIRSNQLYKPFNKTNNSSNSFVNPTYNSSYKIYNFPKNSISVNK